VARTAAVPAQLDVLTKPLGHVLAERTPGGVCFHVVIHMLNPNLFPCIFV